MSYQPTNLFPLSAFAVNVTSSPLLICSFETSAVPLPSTYVLMRSGTFVKSSVPPSTLNSAALPKSFCPFVTVSLNFDVLIGLNLTFFSDPLEAHVPLSTAFCQFPEAS